MANLFEIEACIENCCDIETGEILDVEALEALKMEKEQKLQNLCKWVKNLESDAEQYKAQKQVFADKQRHAENKAKSIRSYVQNFLNGQKWEAADKSVKVGYRTTKDKVFIDDLDAVPEEYFKTPHTETNLNKTQLKEDIQNGVVVPGAHLEDSVSMSIK